MLFFFFFFFKQKTAYDIRLILVGSEMCIRDRQITTAVQPAPPNCDTPSGGAFSNDMTPTEKYRIMGIDPGTNYMGYGVLEIDGRSVRSVVLGDIDLHKLSDPYVKLRYIFERVGALIDQYAPREVALESPFFGENVQSMLKLGRAQGVAMAAALSRGLPVSEYAPMRIKQSITGRGSAAKEQVAAIVCRILSLEQPPKRLDATDGMAVALCHHFTISNPLNAAMGDERVKGLGGGKKAASKGGSQSWEKFLREHPDREIK